jgi:pimeloyl-ACP methyl ester carboxylesterase
MTFSTEAGTVIRHTAQLATRAGAGLHSRTIDVDGFTIGYDEGGRQRSSTVLMLHGFSADRDVWTRFAAGCRDHHVLIPDLPGHGRTPFIAGAGYSAPAQADRMVAFLDAVGVSRVHVIGNSMGGFIAAALARRWSTRPASVPPSPVRSARCWIRDATRSCSTTRASSTSSTR